MNGDQWADSTRKSLLSSQIILITQGVSISPNIRVILIYCSQELIVPPLQPLVYIEENLDIFACFSLYGVACLHCFHGVSCSTPFSFSLVRLLNVWIM